MPPVSSAAMKGVCSQARTRPPCGTRTDSLPITSARVGRVGIEEVVVVALEDVVIALDRDDAVQDHHVQHPAAVGDDVAHPVLVGGSDHREVAAVEARLHAGAAGRDVAGLAADLRRGKEQPGCYREHDERGADQS